MKLIVFKLNGYSVSGPDSFTRVFCKVYWSKIDNDVVKIVNKSGCTLHANLVLLPKR